MIMMLMTMMLMMLTMVMIMILFADAPCALRLAKYYQLHYFHSLPL